jgi:hypothetical protein
MLGNPASSLVDDGRGSSPGQGLLGMVLARPSSDEAAAVSMWRSDPQGDQDATQGPCRGNPDISDRASSARASTRVPADMGMPSSIGRRPMGAAVAAMDDAGRRRGLIAKKNWARPTADPEVVINGACYCWPREVGLWGRALDRQVVWGRVGIDGPPTGLVFVRVHDGGLHGHLMGPPLKRHSVACGVARSPPRCS